MAITPDGTKAYVANYSSNTINVIDIATDTVTSFISDPSLDGPFPLTITPDGSTVYIGNNNNSTISILNVAHNTITGLVSDPHSTLSDIYYLAITPDGTTPYADNFATSNNTFSIINIATNTVTGVLSDPRFDDAYYLIITPDSKTMYAANYGNSTVAIINTATNLVTGLVSDPNSTFNGPYPLAMIPSPQSPFAAMGCQVRNIFLSQTELFNLITWKAPVSGPVPVSYKIYRDAGLTDLIATVPATGPLQYADQNLQQNVTYTYYLVSVDQYGDTSNPVEVIVTQKCQKGV